MNNVLEYNQHVCWFYSLPSPNNKSKSNRIFIFIFHYLLGERRKVLNWLLSYNPLWLQIGLEVSWHKCFLLASELSVTKQKSWFSCINAALSEHNVSVRRQSMGSWSHLRATMTPWAWPCSSCNGCCGIQTSLLSTDMPKCLTFTRMVMKTLFYYV